MPECAAPGQTVLNAARAYVAAGLSVIPVALDGTKRPAFKLLPRVPDERQPDQMKPTWEPFTERLPTDDELCRWFARSPFAIGVVYGQVSGRAECIDLDNKQVAEEFLSEVGADYPTILDRLSLEETPNGMHVVYRCETVQPNTKLASWPDGTDDKGRPKVKTVIETRGEGGYAIAAGSPLEVHSSGRPYRHAGGPPLTELAVLAPHEREYLFRLAMYFDREDKSAGRPRPASGPTSPGGLSPADDYDLRGPAFDTLLDDAEFTNPGRDDGNVRRPGKEFGCSATVGRCRGSRGEPLLKVFTINWPPFEPGKAYGKFHVTPLTKFGGDGAAATRWLRQEGYGTPPSDRNGTADPVNGHPANGKDAPGGPEAGRTDPRFQFIDSATFLTADYRQEFFIPRVLVKGQPGVVAGPSKAMKTSVVVDMGISLAAGSPFLGTFPVPRAARVAIVSGESGRATLQESARRVIQAKGIDPAAVFGRLQWCFELPQFPDLACMTEFAAELVKLRSEVVVIDPVYLCLGGDIDHANLFEMGPAFKVVADVLLKAGVTPLLVHHANRQLQPGKPMEVQHLAYSGLEQFARQFVMINRQSSYRGDGVHDLWLSAGGSAGDGGLWDVHIEEGTCDEHFQGRRWDLAVKDPNEATADKLDRREKAKEEAARGAMKRDETAVVNAIDQIIDGGAGYATKNKIRGLCAKLSAGKLNDVLDRLIEDKVIEEDEATQSAGKGANRGVKAYRRPTRRNVLSG